MYERARLRRIAIAGLVTLALLVALASVPSMLAAATFTVDTLSDGAVEDRGTFRWAVDQANENAGEDTIIFDQALLDQANSDNVLQIVLTSAPLIITSALIIEGPIDLSDGTEYFVDIVRDPNEGEEFEVNENLTLRNAELRSNAIVFNGGTGNTIDLVYDIGDFVHDIFWWVIDHDTQRPLDKPGRLVKTGSGELALLPPTADYSGGTLLVAGVLRTDTRSLQGDVQICENESGNRFESTATQCEEALLIFELPSVTIDPDALRSDPPVNGTYAGDISSESVDGKNGRVVKTGIGTLTLTGDNSYQGGTHIMQGEVVGDTEAIQGDVFICPGVAGIAKPNGGLPITCDLTEPSQLTFDISSGSNFIGTLNGQGIVKKDGPAKLTFDTSQATFAGDVQIDAGELAVNDELGAGAAEVDVSVNHGGTLSGSGTINGDVDVNSGGTLLGSATINGDVDVKAGGEIKGSLNLTADFRLRGTLDLTDQTMTGTTATIDDNSIIAIDIGILGGAGHLDLSDTLTLRAGAVDVEFDPDFVLTLSPGDPARFFTIAESDNPITTQLTGGEDGDGIRFKAAIFNLTLSYDHVSCSGANNVCLGTVFAPVLEDDAVTHNQKAIARALDQAYNCANIGGCTIDPDVAADFNLVFSNFSVPSRDIPDILDQIAGEEYAAFADLRSAGAARFNRSISRRFDLELDAESENAESDLEKDENDKSAPKIGDVSAAGPRWQTLGASARSRSDYRNFRMAWRGHSPKDPMPVSRHAGKGGWTGWMDIHGVMGELDGNNDADDIDYRIYGPLFGIDYGVSENLTVGLSMGYTRNELKTPGTTSKGRGNTYQGGAYLGAMFDKFHLTAAARYAYSDLESRRRMRVGNLDRTATADFDASDTSAFLEAAYHVPLPGSFAVEPVIAVAYNHLSQGAFDESGAVSLNLEIDKQEFDTVQTSLGVRVGIFGRDSEDRYVYPQLRLAYEREWLDKNRSVSANLPSAGTNGAFKLDGLALPRDRVVIGVSSEAGVSDRINLFVDYDLRASKDLLEHSLAFGFRAIW